MKSALLAVLASLLPGILPAAYDPLATPSEGSMLDMEFAVGAERTIPVRIFLPMDTKPAPVVIFSHGLGGTRAGANYLGRHWSARGLVTVFLQHPGSDESIWRDKNRMEVVQAMREAASTEQFLMRVADVKGALDALARHHADAQSPLHGRLNLDRVGMSGHSFGARTTQAVAGQRGGRPGRLQDMTDPRIKAALPMSPSPAANTDPKFSFGSVTVPWLLMTGTHDDAPRGINSTTEEDRLKVYPALSQAARYELVLDGAEHHAFTDTDPAGARKHTRNPAHHRSILAISSAFWDAYLHEDAAALHWLQHQARTVLATEDRWRFNPAP